MRANSIYLTCSGSYQSRITGNCWLLNCIINSNPGAAGLLEGGEKLMVALNIISITHKPQISKIRRCIFYKEGTGQAKKV